MESVYFALIISITHKCAFIQYVTRVVNSMLDCVRNVESSAPSQAKRLKVECKSSKRIPFEACASVAESLRKLDSVSNNQCLMPELEVCTRCGLPMIEDNMKEVVAVTNSKILKLRGIIVDCDTDICYRTIFLNYSSVICIAIVWHL